VRVALIGLPETDELARNPRYQALLVRTGLTDAWQRELSRRVDLLARITGIRSTTVKY
jgi:hypothetical protein